MLVLSKRWYFCGNFCYATDLLINVDIFVDFEHCMSSPEVMSLLMYSSVFTTHQTTPTLILLQTTTAHLFGNKLRKLLTSSKSTTMHLKAQTNNYFGSFRRLLLKDSVAAVTDKMPRWPSDEGSPDCRLGGAPARLALVWAGAMHSTAATSATDLLPSCWRISSLITGTAFHIHCL